MKTGGLQRISHVLLWLVFLLIDFSQVTFAQTPLNVQLSITDPTEENSRGGSIQLDVSGGQPPYSINWCDQQQENVSGITGLTAGEYHYLITDSFSNQIFGSVSLFSELAWLEEIPGFTQNRLSYNQDGFAEFTVADSALDMKVGFIYDNSDFTGNLDWGYGFANHTFNVFVDDTIIEFPGGINSVHVGDSYRIARVGNNFKFFKNGLLILNWASIKDANLGSEGARFGYKRSLGAGSANLPWEFTKLSVSFTKGNSNFYYPYKSCIEEPYNWSYTEIYDGNNIPVGALKRYTDFLGRQVQNQEMNVDFNKILASETKYDAIGRPVMASLTAPINGNKFCFKENFISTVINGANVPYDWTHFDSQSTINTPMPVVSTGSGSLGWYYSNSNISEPYQAASNYPYSRVEYEPFPGGGIKRSTMAGEELQMGSGHESRMFTMPESGELRYVLGPGMDYLTNANTTSELDPIVAAIPGRQEVAAVKTIQIDQNGTEQITFASVTGKVIATCLTAGPACQNSNQYAKLRVTGGHGAALHAPASLLNSNYSIDVTVKARFRSPQFQFPTTSFPSQFKIQVLDLNTYELLDPGDYQLNMGGVTYTAYPMVNNQPSTNCAGYCDYYQFAEGIKFRFTAAYLASHAGNSGYYRFFFTYDDPATDRDEILDIDYVDLSHPLNYTNWSVNYYDQKSGSITKVIPPAGVDCSFFPDYTPVVTNASETLPVYDWANTQYLMPGTDFKDHQVNTAPTGYTQKKYLSLSLAPDYNKFDFTDPYEDNMFDGNPPNTDPTWCALLATEETKAQSAITNAVPHGHILQNVDISTWQADPVKDGPQDWTSTALSQLPLGDAILIKRITNLHGSHITDIEGSEILSAKQFTIDKLIDLLHDQFATGGNHKMAVVSPAGYNSVNLAGANWTNFGGIVQGGGAPDFCGMQGSPFDCNVGNFNSAAYNSIYLNVESWAHLYHLLYCCRMFNDLPDRYNSCLDNPEDANPWEGTLSPYERLKHLATFYIEADLIAENTNNNSITKIHHPIKMRISVAENCCLLFWYGGRIEGAEFSNEELENRNNIRISINKVQVGTGSDPDEYVSPYYTGSAAPIYGLPPHVITDFDPTKRYHDLLKYTIVRLGVRTTQEPTVTPAHTMSTTYCYDGYNQLKGVSSPDEGISEYKYDDEGKLRFTQNAQQREDQKFGYLNYDDYDRVIETGEYDFDIAGSNTANSYYFKSNIAGLVVSQPSNYLDIGQHLQDNLVDNYANHFTDKNNLVYDQTVGLPSGYTAYSPRYLNGRLVKSYNANAATYYSYNNAGQILWALKELPIGIKTFDYDYNIAGNVLKVSYQKGDVTERYFQHYKYNKSFNLAEVYTSFDGNVSSAALQTKYKYYLHGPLKRTELGNKLQGIDYVYTINGWLKSINNPDMFAHLDPGADGTWVGSGTPTAAAGSFAFDAFAENLDYFPGDYRRGNTYVQTFVNGQGYSNTGTHAYESGCYSNGNWVSSKPNIDENVPHYNGLIQSITWRSLTDNDEINPVLHNINAIPSDPASRMQLFNYDYQYRLTSAVFGNITSRGTLNNSNNTVGSSPIWEPKDEYLTYNLSYDRNGNIQTNQCNGAVGFLSRDNLTYHYNPLNNQLDYVHDAAGSTGFEDLGQSNGNYQYDKSGRIIADNAAQVGLHYHPNNKLKEVVMDGKMKVEFLYDEVGNRIEKRAYDASGTSISETTHYVYDVTGKPITIYEHIGAFTGNSHPNLQLEYLNYGLEKVGSWRMHKEWDAGTSQYSRYIDANEFEIKDHLGNVRVVLKNQKDSKGNPIVISHNDYYPFGSVMPGNSLNPPGSTDTRFGYQGKELIGEAGLYDFGLRMYNSDLGRWLSPDPYGQHFSPYLAMGNNPTSFIDPTGGFGFIDKNGDGENDEDVLSFYIDGTSVSSATWSGYFSSLLNGKFNFFTGSIGGNLKGWAYYKESDNVKGLSAGDRFDGYGYFRYSNGVPLLYQITSFSSSRMASTYIDMNNILSVSCYANSAMGTMSDIFKGFSMNNLTNRYKLNPAKPPVVFGINDKYALLRRGKLVEDWIIHFDKPHGAANFEHMNLNERYISIKDPHTRISTGAIEALERLNVGIKAINKVAVPIAVAVDAIRLTNALVESNGDVKSKEVVNTASEIAGGWSGAYVGAVGGAKFGMWAGGVIGSFVPVLGTSAGAAIGGFTFGILGGIAGGVSGSWGANKISNYIY